MPRPFSRAASGSSSGSAHGANLRMARWAITTRTTYGARSCTITEGSLPLRLNPTFAKANATSATAKTSMISSGRPAGRRDQLPVTARSCCSRVSCGRRDEDGTGGDAERLGGRARGAGFLRRRAWLGDLVHRLVVLPGQGHGRLVLVVQRDPGLQRGVLLLARVHGRADSQDNGLGIIEAAGGVGGLERLLIGQRDLVEHDPGPLVGLGQAEPADALVDSAVNDDLALAVGPDVVLVLAPPPGYVTAADDDGEQHHERGGDNRPAAAAGPGRALRLGPVTASPRHPLRAGAVLAGQRHRPQVEAVGALSGGRSGQRWRPVLVEVIVEVVVDDVERAGAVD